MATAQERPREAGDEQELRSEGRLRVEPKRDDEPQDQNAQRAAGAAPTEDLEKTREEEEAAARTAQRKTRIKKIAPVVLVVLAVGDLLWWLHARQYEDTDDAQIDGHISQIGPRIGGYISAVHVEDNQEVQQGQSLVEIDPRDYEVALARAQA